MALLPIAVLISGGGTTLKNLLEYHQRGELPVEFRLVIGSRPDAAGLGFARHERIESHIVARRGVDPTEHSQTVFDHCRRLGVQLAIMGGYLDHLLIPADFENRVVNIHPALIPAFCGKGFYGLRVHQAVLDYGVKISGCTVHFVDNQFDHGPIIAQASCPVKCDDTAESLQKRVFELERQLYPSAVRTIAAGGVSVIGRTVLIDTSL